MKKPIIKLKLGKQSDKEIFDTFDNLKSVNKIAIINILIGKQAGFMNNEIRKILIESTNGSYGLEIK